MDACRACEFQRLVLQECVFVRHFVDAEPRFGGGLCGHGEHLVAPLDLPIEGLSSAAREIEPHGAQLVPVPKAPGAIEAEAAGVAPADYAVPVHGSAGVLVGGI